LVHVYVMLFEEEATVRLVPPARKLKVDVVIPLMVVVATIEPFEADVILPYASTVRLVLVYEPDETDVVARSRVVLPLVVEETILPLVPNILNEVPENPLMLTALIPVEVTYLFPEASTPFPRAHAPFK
jgi:hypothetical protein